MKHPLPRLRSYICKHTLISFKNFSLFRSNPTPHLRHYRHHHLLRHDEQTNPRHLMSTAYQQQESSQAFRWHYAEFDDSEFQIRGRTLFFIFVLFSVVILVALLFLYARWVCRFGPPPPPAAVQQLAHAPPDRPRGLDPATINSFPIVLHKSSASGAGDGTDGVSETECCICLGIFDDGDKVKMLPQCHHCFHSECVDKWLTTQPNCPLCRGSLRVDSPV